MLGHLIWIGAMLLIAVVIVAYNTHRIHRRNEAKRDQEYLNQRAWMEISTRHRLKFRDSDNWWVCSCGNEYGRNGDSKLRLLQTHMAHQDEVMTDMGYKEL